MSSIANAAKTIQNPPSSSSEFSGSPQVPEDDGRGMSGEAALVADRVLAWYAQRPDKWRQRCLEVLAELASGDEDARARAAHRKHARPSGT